VCDVQSPTKAGVSESDHVAISKDSNPSGMREKQRMVLCCGDDDEILASSNEPERRLIGAMFFRCTYLMQVVLPGLAAVSLTDRKYKVHTE
jgi:hypothetical protein